MTSPADESGDAMSALAEALADALAPFLEGRCSSCAGTGTRIVSNLDCTHCDNGYTKAYGRTARDMAVENIAGALKDQAVADALYDLREAGR
ncbi:hypothetical protein NBH00_05075 [Paraconexibacter antarcticus]|uniref:Uncharacterized protein n=1 Tax=Paraconexibacter antarcticus TaxID=2949664 RepID=A0ABY5DXH4_9ACTN|nr:hypothetical protein [Paraconexibacter antarcticus]UTI65582.1 hypothetical protein NBH00_05075 [Paraconexibacter antarcticus]